MEYRISQPKNRWNRTALDEIYQIYLFFSKRAREILEGERKATADVLAQIRRNPKSEVKREKMDSFLLYIPRLPSLHDHLESISRKNL